jgi:hypothetical protein
LKREAKMNDIDTDKISDGYHTFGELYEHRAALLVALMCQRPELSWWSTQHHDGTMFPGGWIIAGMQLPTGQVTYHLRVEPWQRVLTDTGVPALTKAPVYDGHTPEQVIERLVQWTREGGRR